MKHVARFMATVTALVLLTAGIAYSGPDQDYKDGIEAASKGDMDKAITAFSRIVESKDQVEPQNLSSAYNLRGMCYDVKNDSDRAMADFDKAVELNPKSAEALGNRALLWAKIGNVEKAKVDAAAARRIDRKVRVPHLD